jgi:hypothetical protein
MRGKRERERGKRGRGEEGKRSEGGSEVWQEILKKGNKSIKVVIRLRIIIN